MRDTTCELAHRVEPLRLTQLRLGVLLLGDVGHHGENALDLTGRADPRGQGDLGDARPIATEIAMYAVMMTALATALSCHHITSAIPLQVTL
ncbi:hypothetical protein [Frankia tisae]|uniref:hypothetical protein n=1 Tax=Frankia tisae TaxID=2950104 RepID=UPI0021C0F20E|nr:hypothetical protein [Frankia tisae]